jgi:hypothetical protein
MECKKCGGTVEPGESFEHSGQTLCEDCYLDIVSKPKTCDPWAVHSAKNTIQREAILTSLQEQILAVLRKGPVSGKDVSEQLGISEDEFQRNFAALRHMELARGCKVGDQVCYTLFNA